MAEGKLIIEVYEYVDGDTTVPRFEYIPCNLSDCFRRNQKTTLEEIVRSGFDSLPKRSQNLEKKKDILRMLEEASIDHIDVVYRPANNGFDSFIEFTNIVQETFTGANALRAKSKSNDIILRGRYRLAEGHETTRLKDAQRLTLFYSSQDENAPYSNYEADDADEMEVAKAICLNITYLQE